MSDDCSTVASPDDKITSLDREGGDVIDKQIDKNSSSDPNYDEATSGTTLYSLDDIDDADEGEVYSDCISEVGKLVTDHHDNANHPDNTDHRGKINPVDNASHHDDVSGEKSPENHVYFVLEDGKTSGFQGDDPPRSSSQASAVDIARAFDSGPKNAQEVTSNVTYMFENNFIADHDIPKRDHPFSDFTDVERCDPIYDIGSATKNPPGSSESVDNLSGSATKAGKEPHVTESSSGASIYEMARLVPSDTSQHSDKRSPEPIYEMAHEPGELLKMAEKTIAADKNTHKSDSVYELASDVLDAKGQGRTLPSYMSCKQGTGRPVSVRFLREPGDVTKLRTLPTRAAEDGEYNRLRLKQQTRKKRKSLESLNSSKSGTEKKSGRRFLQARVSFIVCRLQYLLIIGSGNE